VANVVGEYGYLVGVVEVVWRRVAIVCGPVVDPVIALVGAGCQQATTILLASCAAYWCVVSEPRHTGRLLVFS
jgi:hypothetical protein